MSGWTAWITRRAKASAILLVTLFLLVAVTTGILAFALGNSGVIATDAARAALRTNDAAEASVMVQSRVGDDRAEQDAIAREALTDGFAPAPVTIWTTYVSEPRRASTEAGPLDGTLTLWSGDHLNPESVTIEGTWPSTPDEAALHRDAAAALGIELGAALTVDDSTFTVTALWAPQDPQAPEWFADPLALQGSEDTTFGPLVVDASKLAGSPFVRWNVVPDVDTIAPSDLAHLAAGAERAKELVVAADVTGRGIVTEGDLAPTAAATARALAIAQAFGFVPVSLIVLVAVVGLIQVAGLLANTRGAELALLFARGSSPGQVAGSGLVESGLLAVLGSVLGTGIAALVVRLIAGHWEETSTVVWGGVLGLGIAVACLGGVAVSSTVKAAKADQAQRTRVRAVAGSAALVLVGATAAVATWQLRRSGSFIRESDGTSSVNLIPAAAPALLLVATAVVGLVALAPVTRILETITRRIGSTTAWLAGAQVARGLVVQAVPVVLTVLATGTATFAALYAGTGTALVRDSSAVSQGAPLRGAVELEPGKPLSIPTLADVSGVTASTPVWIDEAAQVGDLSATALAAPTDALADIAVMPEDTELATDGLVPAAPEGPAPVSIPQDTTTLTISVAGTTYFDQWDTQILPLVPERERSLIEATMPAEFHDAEFQNNMQHLMELASQDSTVTAKIYLRDAVTGVAAVVPGPELVVPGPALDWGGDWDGVTVSDGSAEQSTELELPPGEWLLDGVQIAASGGPNDDAPFSRALDLAMNIDADGTPVLGEATAEWRADTAIRYDAAQPYRDAEAEITPTAKLMDMEVYGDADGATYREITSNREVPQVATVDPAGDAWEFTLVRPLTVSTGPFVDFLSTNDPLGVVEPDNHPTPRVPVAITPALAENAALAVGDTFDVTMLSRPMSAEVVSIADTIPGVTTSLGLLVDSRAWSAARAADLLESSEPTQVWASTEGDPQAVAAGATDVADVTNVTASAGTDGGSAPAAQAFWVAAASAMVLAVTGLAAATATQVRARRSEVAVLRATGMTPSAQGWSRALEMGGVLSLATLAGIGAGWLISWLIMEPVARSGSTAQFLVPTRLTLDVIPWLALLAAGAVAVVAVMIFLSKTVRRQALDNEYREEVR